MPGSCRTPTKRSAPTGNGEFSTRKSPVRQGGFGHREAQMDNTTLLIILIIVVIVLGGGWYGRGRWF